MNGRGLVSAAVCVVVFTVAVPSANADERTCHLDSDSQELVCQLVTSPAPPLTRRLASDLPLVWKRIPMNIDDLIPRGRGCVRTSAEVLEIGAAYAVALINVDTGEVLYLEPVCQWPGTPPPTPPPPPPTMPELVQANAEVLTLQPLLSPASAIGGLTGLDSWLWCADPGAVVAAANLRGWTAAGSVELVQTGWNVAGPAGLDTTGSSCGSPDVPAATWMPEMTGDYTVALTSTWAGTWDLTWNGIAMGTFPLGPLSITAGPTNYPVSEYRGELSG